jgi:NMD protein affecting ribosome stability and mRNA decay
MNLHISIKGTVSTKSLEHNPSLEKEETMKIKKMQTLTKRKSIDTADDPYRQKMGRAEAAICTRCHAVYKNKRWYLSENIYKNTAGQSGVVEVTCPACKKIKDSFPGGIVRISGDFIRDHVEEIMNLVRNEEDRARGFNPLERIMKIHRLENGYEITTTNEKLAQRIARRLERAYQGHVNYKWSDGTKLLRAEWVRHE